MRNILFVLALLFICRVANSQDMYWHNELYVYKSNPGDGQSITNGLIPAQPGSTLFFQPIGDYRRGAIDLLPTTGLKPDRGALAELTLHRIAPTYQGVEMMSIAALARPDIPYAVIIESTGIGKIHPLTFLFVEQDLNFQNHVIYEPLKLTKDGCTFGGEVVLKSPNGKAWTLAISDEGELSVTEKPEIEETGGD